MNELKPCPFCGGTAHFVNTPESESGVCVECERCLTSSRVIYPSKQDPFPELVQAWNKRQFPDSITCEEHEWPYGFNIDGDCRPKCVWCECLRADALERKLVQRKNTMSKTAFRKELCNLINRESMENGSDTPDFILAEYLSDCLEVFDRTTKAREKWYGRDAKPVPSYEWPESDLPPHENEEPSTTP